MKKVFLFALVFAVSGAVFGQEFTFRGFPWGATVGNIITKEGEPDSNTHGQLIYENKTVEGYPASLFFYCNSSNLGLEMGRYVIGVNNTNSQAVYNDLLSKLSVLYGSPTPEIKPNFTAPDKYNYWVVSNTLVSLTMIVAEQRTLIFIDYHSPQLNDQ